MSNQEIIMPRGVASKGIAMGRLFVAENTSPICHTVSAGDCNEQVLRFQKAAAQAADELSLFSKKHPIFASHLEIARDETLLEAVEEKIKRENKTAAQALLEHTETLCRVFDGMEDDYLRGRGDDIRDVSQRILGYLQGQPINPFANITENVIIGAEEILPSHTAQMDFHYVKGFITETGGKTSHVAIIAADRGIPAMLGVEGFLKVAKPSDFIILDGNAGKILINPDSQTRAEYEKKLQEQMEITRQQSVSGNEPVFTKDGQQITLFANAGSVWDVENAVSNGAQGIGLFRTEFLYMESSDFPSEDEQFLVYRQAVTSLQKPLLIRTLDIGGDKALPYYTFEKEDNPFLGWRAIRFCLARKDILKTQLRAILRASAYGDVRIMLPMLVSIDELRQANAILQECKSELIHQKILFNEKILVGIMVETPAAVLQAESFAKEVDFFSIGTNDLTQYILAADRGNSKVAYLYDPYHPAVLKAMDKVISAAATYGKEVGMCGAFAADETAIPILLGMGLREFSIPASAIPSARHIVSQITIDEAESLYHKIRGAKTNEESRSIAGVN